MKTSTTSNIRPYKSKQLLFEEEQKKRAAKRDSVLGNLQSTGAAAPQRAAAQTKPAAQGGIVQTKPASLVSSGKQNSGGIIQMKPNAFSPNARTANAAAGMVKSDNSSTVRMQSTGSTGNLQKPRRTPNMTRGEAWGMLENERKDKRSFSVPSGFSEQGKDVFMQLMELPDWGLDGSESKKHEKVVELNSSYPLPNKSFAAKTGGVSHRKIQSVGDANGLNQEGFVVDSNLQKYPYRNFWEGKTNASDEMSEVAKFKGEKTFAIFDRLPSPKLGLLSRQNYESNRRNDIYGRMIHGQEVDPVADMRYGFFKMSYSGCGPIAVSNALTLKGRPVPMSQVAYDLENSGGLLLGGLFGTDARVLGSILSKYGVDNYRTFYSLSGIEAQEGDVFILTLWNNTNSDMDAVITALKDLLLDGDVPLDERWNGVVAAVEGLDDGFMEELSQLAGQHHICVSVEKDASGELVYCAYNRRNDEADSKDYDTLAKVLENGLLVYGYHIME